MRHRVQQQQAKDTSLLTGASENRMMRRRSNHLQEFFFKM
jgi:hypothetical protein